MMAGTKGRSGPREKLASKGAQSLADADLIAVLLGTGTQKEPSGMLARRILGDHGGLMGLARAGFGELGQIHGVGPTKATRLMAAIELGSRAVSRPLALGEPLENSDQVLEALGPRLSRESREWFIALPLDAKNRVLGEIDVAVGGLVSCGVVPGDVFRSVLRYAASGVVFVHNHPSGDPEPSEEDKALTLRLVQAGDLLGVRVLDHIVLGRGSLYSFADESRRGTLK